MLKIITLYFKAFIEDASLGELPLVGRKFTCCNRTNDLVIAMSRLDIFLVSKGWLKMWKHFPRGLQIGLLDC